MNSQDMIKTIKISDKVYILEDAFGTCSNLVIGAKKALLFDTGCGLDDINAAVRKITDLPLLVIASHGHFDHIGGSRFFDKVFLSEKDRNILDTYDEALLNKWISEMGDGDDYKTQDSENAIVQEITFGCKEWKQIANLDFGRFDLGDLEGEVIELPGHSAGSVGIIFRKLRLVLGGDALSPIITLIFKNHGSIEEQRSTIKKSIDLDFDYFLVSHNNKLLKKEILYSMAACLENTEEKRFIKYTYPKPPYGEGYFHVHSLRDEPVGLIVEQRPTKIK